MRSLMFLDPKFGLNVDAPRSKETAVAQTTNNSCQATALPSGVEVVRMPKLSDSGDVVTSDYPAALTQVREWFQVNKEFKILDDKY